MLTTLLYLVSAIGVLVLIMLVIVVASIRREPSTTELSLQAPGPVSALVRRLLGVSVRRPDSEEPGRRDACLTSHGADGER